MATAASFVSESGDHAMDDQSPDFSLEAFGEGLAKEGWCGEVGYPDVVCSDATRELIDAINSLLEEHKCK